MPPADGPLRRLLLIPTEQALDLPQCPAGHLSLPQPDRGLSEDTHMLALGLLHGVATLLRHRT